MKESKLRKVRIKTAATILSGLISNEELFQKYYKNNLLDTPQMAILALEMAKDILYYVDRPDEIIKKKDELRQAILNNRK